MTAHVIHRLSIGLLIVTCVLFGFALATFFQSSGTGSASSNVSYPLEGPVFTQADGTLPPQSFIQIADKTNEAVVSIAALSIRGDNASSGSSGPPKGGSGFIIDANGYILTNWHVVENSDKVLVTVLDDGDYNATVVGGDRETDLALLKIKPRGRLPVAVLGDSDNVRPGEWAMAIGHPAGLSHTITVGVVSGIGRTLGTRNTAFWNFIQTDAAINPGNSGGPLLNIRGEVIGINTLIFQGTQNLGFSIPINLAKTVVAQLRIQGYVKRGYLGLRPAPITEGLRQALDLPDQKGAIVSSVDRGMSDNDNTVTPAYRAGIRTGDVITSFDGHEIETVEELYFRAAYTPPGKTVQVAFIRDGNPRTVSVTLVSRPQETRVELPHRRAGSGRYPLGLRVTSLNASQKQMLYNASDGNLSDGVRVLDVEVSADAFDQGIRPGDIIVSINKREVSSSDEYSQAVARSGAEGDYVLLYVVRFGDLDEWRFVAVRK